MRYFLFIFLLLNLWSAPATFAASVSEKRVFDSARQLLDTGLYGLAEMNFAKFVQEHPQSPQRGEAILHQAQSRFFQKNYTGALELLQKEMPQAGALADDYQYWIAQSYFETGNYRAAADASAALLKNFPQSKHFLEACYDEALAESKLGHWPRVIELLQSPDGQFETAAKAQPNNASVVDGYLLLAEAFLKQSQFAEGEKVLSHLGGRVAVPETKWRQNDLLCRIQLAAGRPADALATSTNLLAAAQEAAGHKLFAESTLSRGEVLEKLNRLPEAVEAYEQNFAEGTPVEIRRQSFFKTVDLELKQDKATNAVQRLKKFILQNPNDASLDLAARDPW